MSSMVRLEGDTGNIGAPSVEQQINTVGIGRFQYLLLFIFGLIVVADGGRRGGVDQGGREGESSEGGGGG